MNADRLRTIITFALEREQSAKIQNHLQGLTNALANLAGTPNNSNHQTETANNLSALDAALRDFENSLTPGQKRDLVDIKAFPFFSTSLVEEIRRSMSQNPITPSVTHQLANKLLTDRQSYLNVLGALRDNFSAVGVELKKLEPGDAEIGILLPRDLFNNELDKLQKELRTLNQILRTFYEIANVPPSPIEVRDISTSDPTFFLGMDVTALVHLSHALKWCLDTLKTIFDLKRFIQEAKALDIDPKKTAIFDDEIAERVKKRIEEQAAIMMSSYKGEPARRNELANSLNLALEQMLQRVERGLTVEIRLLPPAQPKEGDAEGQKKQKEFAEVGEIAKSLEFPQIQGQPALQLTDVENRQSYTTPT